MREKINAFELMKKMGGGRGRERDRGGAFIPFSELHFMHLLSLFAVAAGRDGSTFIRLLAWTRHSQKAWKPM